jgi:DNA repair protein RadC
VSEQSQIADEDGVATPPANPRASLAGEEAELAGVRELVEALLGGKCAAKAGARIAAVPDMGALARYPARRLELEFGISKAGAVRLSAAFALGRRVERAARAPRPSLRTPALVHDLLAPDVRGLERETFHALLLDGKHRLQAIRRISEGTLTCSLVHPREVFGPALREGAAALIVAHNHPSGDPEPSAEDVSVTRRLIEVGRLVGVPLVDHVVIGEGRWVSLRERMPFES